LEATACFAFQDCSALRAIVPKFEKPIQTTMPGAEALLPPHLLRSLGQKEYDKRKGAALEIEQTIKELRDTGQHDKVRSARERRKPWPAPSAHGSWRERAQAGAHAGIERLPICRLRRPRVHSNPYSCSRHAHLAQVRDLVQYVVVDLAGSPHPNVRKGALHALAGVAIGLREELPRFLSEILPPILAAFTDPDCRVRYYACESLYNVAKVSRVPSGWPPVRVCHYSDTFERLVDACASLSLRCHSHKSQRVAAFERLQDPESARIRS
jgi:hypothetical protein